MLKLKSIITIMLLAMVMTVSAGAEQYGLQKTGNLDIDIWVNKGDNATYYYGEDVAVYFRTSDDCYVVVYDIDPAGNVSLLFPRDYDSDCFVRGGQVYRIPDYQDNYRLEISGPRGYEYIQAVASYDYIRPPDFIRYESYSYGDWSYYSADFVYATRGERERFIAELNDRIVGGPYVQASVSFYINNAYRHHRWYRHWYDDPYAVGSVWIGVDWPGCEVWIDGYYWGIAPILVPSIYIGRHWVWIYYNGYPCWHDYFYVYRGRRAHVDIKVKRRDGRIVRYDGRDDDKIRRWELKHERYRNEDGFFSDKSKYRVETQKILRNPPDRIIEKYGRKDSARNIGVNKVIGNDYDYTIKINNDERAKSPEEGKIRRTDRDRATERIQIRDDSGVEKKIIKTDRQPILEKPVEIEKPKQEKIKTAPAKKTDDDSPKSDDRRIKSRETEKQPSKSEPSRFDDRGSEKRGRK